MAATVLSYGARHLLGKKMDKLHKDGKGVRGTEDPYFETITLPNGKKKKVKRQIPDFIPEHDAAILVKVKDRAYHYDMSLFSLFGLRFGWESVIGLIPELGDVIGLTFAWRIYKHCCKIEGGLPKQVQSTMVFNIVVDFLIGLVPFVGDLIDAAWKCNTKNVQVLENYLRDKYGPQGKKNKRFRRSAGLEMFQDDPDYEPELAKKPIRPVSHRWDDAPDYEEKPDQYSSQPRQDRHAQSAPVTKGSNAPVAATPQGSAKKQGFMSRYFGSTAPEHEADVEAGQGRPANRFDGRN